MAEQKEACSFPPVRAPILQLAVEQPSTGRGWNPPKKDTLSPKTKNKWYYSLYTMYHDWPTEIKKKKFYITKAII